MQIGSTAECGRVRSLLLVIIMPDDFPWTLDRYAGIKGIDSRKLTLVWIKARIYQAI